MSQATSHLEKSRTISKLPATSHLERKFPPEIWPPFISNDFEGIPVSDFLSACLQVAANLDNIDTCRALVEHGVHVDPDMASAADPRRDTRLIGLGSNDQHVQAYFRNVNRFWGRFKLAKLPTHTSPTWVVIQATDVEENKDVILKFMHDKEAFDREIEKRQLLKDGADQHVISILEHCHLETGVLANFKQVRLTSSIYQLLNSGI